MTKRLKIQNSQNFSWEFSRSNDTYKYFEFQTSQFSSKSKKRTKQKTRTTISNFASSLLFIKKVVQFNDQKGIEENLLIGIFIMFRYKRRVNREQRREQKETKESLAAADHLLWNEIWRQLEIKGNFFVPNFSLSLCLCCCMVKFQIFIFFPSFNLTLKQSLSAAAPKPKWNQILWSSYNLT